MKPEDWQKYQAQEAGGDPRPPAVPPRFSPSQPAAPPKSGRLGWPMALLLLGLGLIGGCCYSFNQLLGSFEPSEKAGRPSVGVLVLESEIFGSIWVTETLHKFQTDRDIKSVVIRINSPGGAVAPCQEIYAAVKAMDKPVVVSMGAVAASGGLYVASAGDVIMANPGTVTGSIGVIMQSVELTETMEKIGVKSLTIKSGEFKDMGSPFRAMRPDENQILQTMVMEVYEQFVADLAAGRPGLSLAEVRRLADGRVYSGTAALKLGLVDELGGFEEALTRAAKMGGLSADERPELVIEDGRKPWWQAAMFSRLNLDLKLPPALTPGFSLKYIYQPDLAADSSGPR